MIAHHRRSSLLAIFALVAALGALTLTFGLQNAEAASYRSCSLSESEQDPRGSKPTYNLTLKRKVSGCSTAKKVMRSFHACRAKSSAKCTRRVRTHWTCSGVKTRSSSTVFYGKFTCKWGTRRVQGTYQQND